MATLVTNSNNSEAAIFGRLWEGTASLPLPVARYLVRIGFSDDDKARISAAVTLTACERARLRGSSDEWLNPTLLGAAFDAGDVEKAQDVANQVVIDGHSVWKLDTILEDCRTSAKLYEDSCRGELLEVVDQLQALLGPKPML